MNVVKLATFEEFEKQTAAALDDLKRKHSGSEMLLSPLLFRGHSKASWDLKTTLERYSLRQYSMKDYWSVMRRVKPTVESLTDESWDIGGEYKPDDEGVPNTPQGYNFVVYLRHHRFPSPLLDWTRSPYVAAFFAFEPDPGPTHLN